MSLVERALRNAEQHALAELFPTPNPYLADPVGWAEQRLGEFLWSDQKSIMCSVRDHRRTAVHAAHDVSKSFTAGRAAAWWIDVHPPGMAFVVTTAPTWKQVEVILWREIGRAHRKGGLPGRITLACKWWLPFGGNEEIVAIGQKPADPTADSEDMPATFQGIHAPYVLVIIDEAGGVPSWIWGAVGKLVTNDDSRVLAIGNPDYEGSDFETVCRPSSGWNVIHVDGLRSPNFTGESVPPDVSQVLLGRTRVDEIISDYVGPRADNETDEEFDQRCNETPQYLIQVRGLFPADRSDGVIPLSWLRQCQGESATARISPLREPVQLGVDVGGSENGDWTVIAGREGMRAMPTRRDWMLRVDALDAEKIVDLILNAIREVRATSIKVDVGGVGYNVVGSLERRVRQAPDIYWPVTVLPVNVGEASALLDQRQRPRFANIKAEIWWEAGRELSKTPGRWDLTDVDESTITQLTDVRWASDKAERITIEKKADVKKRTGRSPDQADALLLAFYEPKPKGGVVQAARVVDRRHAGRR